MAKKKEKISDEIKEAAEEALEKAEEIVEEAIESAKEGAEKVEELLEGKEKKKGTKKTEKKAEKKATKSPEETSKDDKKAKLAALLKKAKAFEGGISGEEKVDIKSRVKGEEEKKDTLVPMEDYLKASTHLGTRVITPDMKSFVYRRRADGLAVFNTSLQDDVIREGAEYLAKYAPEQIVVACKREAGWKAVEKLGQTLGIKFFTKKYPTGTLTNPNLEEFFEKDLIFVCDPWLDKNILKDATRIKIPVIAICDTNNYTKGIDKIIPANNKSNKSLGMVLYLLTKLYSEKRGMKVKLPEIQEFIDGWDKLEPPQ